MWPTVAAPDMIARSILQRTIHRDMLYIRRYRDADCDEVWRLHNLALDDVGAHAGNGAWDDDVREIGAVYLSDGGEFLVGVLREKIVAMGALKRTSSSRAEVKRMRVHPDQQRKGFGRAILLELERRAVERGYSAVHLDTTVQQTAAQHLYEENGYAKIGHRRVGDFQCIFYEKQLDGANDGQDR